MSNNNTMSEAYQDVSLSNFTTNETTFDGMTAEHDTNMTTELFSSNKTDDLNNASETPTVVMTFGSTEAGHQSPTPGVVPAVIVCSMTILILAVIIFGVRSRRRKRQPMRRKKQEENDTQMTEISCKESIYLDVMLSTTIDAEEEDELQVERETPYVTLEFESSKKNGDIQSEGVRTTEDTDSLLESQETKL